MSNFVQREDRLFDPVSGAYVGYIDLNGREVLLGVSGGGTPGGSNTQLQFNNAGAFAGTIGLTWESARNRLENAASNLFSAPATIDSSNTATYDGRELTLASGGTLTIAAGASLPNGLTLYPNASVAGTLAVSGGATVSGGTASKTLVAGGVYALVQVSANIYRLTGGAAV